MKKRRPIDRHCDKCGRWYPRCNKYSVWDEQNPGKRGGWHKEEKAYCTDCQPAKAVQKVLVVAHTNVVQLKPRLALVRKSA
jgi:hypothetical protein